MLQARQVDTLTGRPLASTSKRKLRDELPFKAGFTYSAMEAYVINVQGALCETFELRPDMAKDVLVKAADEFFDRWFDITQTPHTLLAVFARMQKGAFMQWTVRVINKDELPAFAAKERWDCSWNLDLHQLFNEMMVRAEEHGIPLPERDAPVEEWSRPAR